MFEQNGSNEEEMLELDQKASEEEVEVEHIWQSHGINLEGVMEGEDLWFGQEHTMYNYAVFGKPSENRADLERQRDQLKIEME